MSESPLTFNSYSIIAKKRDGLELSCEEINWFIKGVTSGTIPDYQAAALLMAIYLRGATAQETAFLTDSMLYSGKTIEFNSDLTVDKHSTGGVGDKTSFVLGPLAAACGVKVPMIAGRGLGHTGGTVDKVESIAGFNTNCSIDEFKKMVLDDGICMIGQTDEIAPADKKIYALRDVTATIESIPLITASIMSKKLAEGASGIVMDIKTGAGAFMAKKSDARKLAKSIRDTALRFNRNIVTSITDMNQPLGLAVGHSLEVIECIDTLKGKGPKDLTDISVHLAGAMVHLAGLAKTLEAGKRKAKAAIKDGSGVECFKQMIERQGGNPKVCDDYSLFPVADTKTEVVAEKAGYITAMNAKDFGVAALELGGGRKQKSDSIDFGVGVMLKKKIGQKVKAGEVIAEIIHNTDQKKQAEEISKSLVDSSIKISKNKSQKDNPLILETKISWSK